MAFDCKSSSRVRGVMSSQGLSMTAFRDKISGVSSCCMHNMRFLTSEYYLVSNLMIKALLSGAFNLQGEQRLCMQAFQPFCDLLRFLQGFHHKFMRFFSLVAASKHRE